MGTRRPLIVQMVRFGAFQQSCAESRWTSPALTPAAQNDGFFAASPPQVHEPAALQPVCRCGCLLGSLSLEHWHTSSATCRGHVRNERTTVANFSTVLFTLCRLQDEDSTEYGEPIVPESAVADAIRARTEAILKQVRHMAAPPQQCATRMCCAVASCRCNT